MSHPLNKSKNCIRWLAAGYAAAGIAILLFYFYGDLPVAQWMQKPQPTLVAWATHTADAIAVGIVILCCALVFPVLLLHGNRSLQKKLALPPAAMLAATLAVALLKPLFGRWRPNAFFLHGEYGFEFLAFLRSDLDSFPSGHTARTLAAMAAVALLFPRWRVPCLAMALLVAASRVVAGEHYPSDVMAGLLTGWLCALLARRLLFRHTESDLRKSTTP